MKDGKKTNAKKKNTKVNHNTSKPKVKEVKVEENFFDDDDDKNDKRLIVFAIIAILVILATIVTLVIGCDRKKQEEPEKPIDDIVVPEKKDDKKEEDEGVPTKEIVRKVAAVYTGNETTEDDTDSEEEEEETNTHSVIFDYGDDTTTRTEEFIVEDGDTVDPFTPKGAFGCYYYTGDGMEDEDEFDFETPITEDITIYARCEIIMYNIVYGPDEITNPGNLLEWDIYEEDTELNPIEDDDFDGW